MGREIRVSIPRSLFATSDPERRGYLKTIAAHDLDIELFTPTFQGASGPLGNFVTEELYNQDAVARATELGLTVNSVHATPLVAGLSATGGSACANKILDAQFTFDDDTASEADDHVDRSRYCDPDLFVFHPPRVYANEPHDEEVCRQRILGTLANAERKLAANQHIDTPSTLTIENVCPRDPFDYFLTKPADIEAFRIARDQLQCEQPDDSSVPPAEYTLDVGHAQAPMAMLETMGQPTHVHLHGTVSTEATTERRAIRDTYDVDTDVALGQIEPPGEIHHLPPHEGNLPLADVLNALDDVTYDGPLVLELAPPYRTPPTLESTLDELYAIGP